MPISSLCPIRPDLKLATLESHRQAPGDGPLSNSAIVVNQQPGVAHADYSCQDANAPARIGHRNEAPFRARGLTGPDARF